MPLPATASLVYLRHTLLGYLYIIESGGGAHLCTVLQSLVYLVCSHSLGTTVSVPEILWCSAPPRLDYYTGKSAILWYFPI